MNRSGQVYTHQSRITPADQTSLFDLIMSEREVCEGSSLGVQTNGWSTPKYEFTGSVCDVVLNQALLTMRMLLDKVSQKPKPLRYWFLCLEQGGQVLLHDHHQSDWAGVLYPHDTEDDSGGAIMFEDGTTIRPKAGLFVVFPGTLQHRVKPYTGRTPRLSIAFNRDI